MILRLAARCVTVPKAGSLTGRSIRLITILQNFPWRDSIHLSIANYAIRPLFFLKLEQIVLIVIPTCITRPLGLIVPGAIHLNHGSLIILQIFTGRDDSRCLGHICWLNVRIVINLHHFSGLNRLGLNASIVTRKITLQQAIQTMSRATCPPIVLNAIR